MLPTAPSGSAQRATRCWTLVGDEGAVDLEITTRDSDTLRAVLPALSRALRMPVEEVWEHSARLPDETPLTAPALRHGAVLGVGRPAPPAGRSPRRSALELHVVGGPDSGRTLPLDRGRHVLGRGSAATVSLDDPDVSRRHVAVHVGGGRITVADLGSTNGSRLDDEELTAEPRPWPVAGVLRLGTSALTLAGAGRPEASVTPASGGRVVLRPAARLDPPAADREIGFPRPPAAPPRRRLAWAAVALPAVGGGLMAWLLSAPTFLYVALLSPLVPLAGWLSERWTGRRAGRDEAAAHAREVHEAEGRLADAVRAWVRAVEAAHPDLATLGTAVRRRARPLWGRAGGDGDAGTVRLGSGPGSTGVIRVDADGSRQVQGTAHLPAVVDLRRDGGLAVIGPPEYAHGVLRSAVAQLCALLPPSSLDLVLLLDPARTATWRWARWLPHLRPGSVHVRSTGPVGRQADEHLLGALTDLVDRRRTLGDAPAGGRERLPQTWTVVVVDRPVDSRLATVLREAREAGVLTLTWGATPADVPVGQEASFRLGGETGQIGRLCRRGLEDLLVDSVDRLPTSTAVGLARDLAGLVPASASAPLPRSLRLLDLSGPGVRLGEDDAVTGAWSSSRDRLRTVLGRAVEGPVVVDLCADGPHALVAGTTGSGKSELLQTLIAGLALSHPPARCSFLLVDYKGGAAFAEAAALPHTVGVLTDLDGQSTARALRSLTAELTRRERILAAHSLADLAGLGEDVDLARLVIVVDEFATLADELPSFVPGLISIARRGRSLGVHLVLATQRPAGVVSPEIRANCSLRICLRTTDETDSRDVLGTSSAAHLPVDLPGRAYLRSGNGAPVLLQVARVAVARPSGDVGPDVHRWAWPATVPPPAAPPTGPSDLARIAGALAASARASRVPQPYRPWRPPLPDHLDAAGLRADPAVGGRPATRLRIGLVDLPDAQSQRPLELDLADGGTWLVVGGPRSGRSTLLRTVLREAVARTAPDDLHVHLVELGGPALGAEATGLPHVGTVVSGEDGLRTVRLVQRLGDEITARRASADVADRPRLLLLVDGIERLSTLVEEALPGQGATTLDRLLRDGAAAGLTCVVTADRAVPGGRLAGLARHRLVLPLPDRADYAMAGIPLQAVPGRRPPGRALLDEEALECQLARPRSPGQSLPPPGPAGRVPLRIAELPPDPAVRTGIPAPTGRRVESLLLLVVGPGGDEGDPLAVDLTRTGGLLVAGPPGSGRTAAVDAFAEDLRHRGVPLLRLGHATTAGREHNGGASSCPWMAPSDETAVRAWADGLDGRPGVILADDLGSPAECPPLSAWALGGTQVVVIAAAQPAQLAAHFQGPVAALRRSRTGLLLCAGPGDADLLGVRLPRTPVPVRPGSGWLVTGGRAERVQVARRRIREPEQL